MSLDYPQNINVYFSNLVSLGFIVDMVSVYRVDDTIYNKIIKEYEFEQLKAILVPDKLKNLSVTKSYFKVTDIGKLFIKSCVK